MKKLPSYRLHKASNQAITRIAGRTYYLGEFGSEESKNKFNQLVASYLTDPNFGIEKGRQSIAEAVIAYLKHAEVYYRAGSEFVGMRDSCKPLVELFASVHLSDFGIAQFKSCRQYWIDRKCSRQYVNKQTKRLLRVVKWWVAEGIAEPTLHQALKCVEPLKRGRCECPDTEPVKPVDDAIVDKTIKFLPPILRDMVRLHQLLGCRPGEIVKLTPAMVNRSGEVWVVRLVDHKTAWRGHNRDIYVGPKAQAILLPYLETCSASDVIFSPKIAVEQRLQENEQNRKTPLSCGNRRGSNRKSKPRKSAGDAYTTQSYGKAIAFACKQAEVPTWSPNQLRHSAATKIRESEGIEGASVILGHKSLDVTQVYAEKSKKLAFDVAVKHG
jgi:integrase